MQDTNLYRSYPIYHTPFGNSGENRLSPRSFADIPTNTSEKKHHHLQQVADDFSVLGGLQAMGFEGLTREDQLRKDYKTEEEVVGTSHKHGYETGTKHHEDPSKCKCMHGFEPCCKSKKRGDAEVHYYEAPVTHHYRSESHYCITGDEPYCQVLRDLRHKTTSSKEEKAKIVKTAQADVQKPVPQKEVDQASRGRSKT